MDEFRQGDSYEEESTGEVLDETAVKTRVPPVKIIVIAIIGIFFVVAIGGYLIKNGKTAKVEDVPESSTEVEIIPYEYTGDEIAELRSYGYTADEIEQNELDYVAAEDLVKTAKDAMRQKLLEQYNELSENAKIGGSKEYMDLLEDTWLSGPLREVKSGEEKLTFSTEHKENVNYEKLPAHGNQLFVKIYLEDGTIAFMVVQPARYQSLNDTGNMLVRYKVTLWQEEAFITEITEIPIS